ncbi:flavin reductase family protein [Streptomyces sp. NPDC049954]|uniref:flavin reductase family protein n=1 Tax=Streptomyces sp. NPDC049954 TaxID=3155779 RepID=UPI00342BD9CA
MPAPATTAPAEPAHGFGPAEYRKVLGRVPTAVSVVTASTPDGPVGVTVGSFTSVSLQPPLVMFFCDLASTSAAAVARAGRFCVNVLAEDQRQQCQAFASRTGDRFASCSWETGADGAPHIEGCLAWIDCEVENTFPAGDHIAVLGRVRRLRAATTEHKPLVFYGGRLGRLDPAPLRHAPTAPFGWWDAGI